MYSLKKVTFLHWENLVPVKTVVSFNIIMAVL